MIVEAAREHEAVAALWDHGTCGVEVKAAVQGRVELVTYFEREPDRLALQGVLPHAELAAVPVPEVDWVARSREGFRPFQVGRSLVTPRCCWSAPRAASSRRRRERSPRPGLPRRRSDRGSCEPRPPPWRQS